MLCRLCPCPGLGSVAGTHRNFQCYSGNRLRCMLLIRERGGEEGREGDYGHPSNQIVILSHVFVRVCSGEFGLQVWVFWCQEVCVFHSRCDASQRCFALRMLALSVINISYLYVACCAGLALRDLLLGHFPHLLQLL